MSLKIHQMAVVVAAILGCCNGDDVASDKDANAKAQFPPNFDPIEQVFCEDGDVRGARYLEKLKSAVDDRISRMKNCGGTGECIVAGEVGDYLFLDVEKDELCNLGSCCGQEVINAEHLEALRELERTIDQRCAEFVELCKGRTDFLICDCFYSDAVPTCVDGTCQMISPDGAVP